jgi:transposase
MNVHKNARLTVHSRADLVRRVLMQRQPVEAVGEAFGVSIRTVRKWVARYQAEGAEGLKDRSSRPRRLRRPTPAEGVAKIERLRRQRWTGKQIAAEVGVSPATVSRILKRLGLNRIKALEPAEPMRRYERQHPGELIHIDIKKLGRFDKVGHRITGERTGQSKSRGIGHDESDSSAASTVSSLASTAAGWGELSQFGSTSPVEPCFVLDDAER